jgi:hypothetical protein
MIIAECCLLAAVVLRPDAHWASRTESTDGTREPAIRHSNRALGARIRMGFHLMIFEPDLKNVTGPKSAFADAATIDILHVDSMLYSKPPKGNIDVLYLPLAAAERWGSKPLIHESQILATTEEDQREVSLAIIPSGPEMPRFLLAEV